MSEFIDDPYIIRIGFNMDTNFETITINYKKIQEVLAEVGGFIDIILIITSIIVEKF